MCGTPHRSRATVTWLCRPGTRIVPEICGSVRRANVTPARMTTPANANAPSANPSVRGKRESMGASCNTETRASQPLALNATRRNTQHGTRITYGIIRSMQISHRADRARWGMIGLLIIAFAVRVFSLTHQSLWRDEVDALRFATASWSELLGTFTRPGWNGPLYFALLRGWIALTGRTEFALRYFSLLAGVTAVALAFVLARRLSNRFAAFSCALLFALSPYFIWYSQETKMYALILALVTLAIYALRRAVGKGGAAWWATFVVATSLAVYCHILAALIIPVEMILALIWGLEAHNGGWWKGALASFACLTLPYLPLLRWQLPLVFSPAQTGFAFYSFDQILLVMLTGFATGISGLLTATPATARIATTPSGRQSFHSAAAPSATSK